MAAKTKANILEMRAFLHKGMTVTGRPAAVLNAQKKIVCYTTVSSGISEC